MILKSSTFIRNVFFLLVSFIYALPQISNAQTIEKSYSDFDFVSGEKTIFEDNFVYGPAEKPLNKWTLEGGKASITKQNNEVCLSIDEYYTKLKPILFSTKILPDSFSIEYDTWLDNGYDGNPGIEIKLRNGDNEVVITPNKHELVVSFPGDGREAKSNPEAYFGENKFYDRWVHISISYYNKRLQVYLDQYKMIDIADCRLKAQHVIVSGNMSQGMKILLKNFRIAKGFPSKINFVNGKFTTRAIKFDVDKANLKPESITIIKQVYNYLKSNAAIKVEIGGHTDSDGSDEHNMTLSQQRANAVKDQLVSMGISTDRLLAKGYGESSPVDNKPTAEAKATNRRVEFTIIK